MSPRINISGVLFFILLISALQSAAQVWPGENAKLNYRIVGFTFPAFDKKGYTLEIAAGNYYNTDSFKKNVFLRQTSKTNRLIAEVPSWACGYTWRVTGLSKSDTTDTLHRFSTGYSLYSDTAIARLRILKHATKYKDAFVFLDANRTLYDMNGNPVWFLPSNDSQGRKIQASAAMDLHLSPKRTITFLSAQNEACEVDYNGMLLWRKSGIGREKDNYHHAFDRLSNGHYMILGDEGLVWEDDTMLNRLKFFSPGLRPDLAKEGNKKINFGTIEEFDEKGNKIWEWRSSVYYEPLIPLSFSKEYYDVHANAFFLDKKGKCLYVSFKGTNQIVKVNYPEGNVLTVYGGPVIDSTGINLFCSQHACRVSTEGYLYLFDNNDCAAEQKPIVKVFAMTGKKANNLAEVWSYQYPFVPEEKVGKGKKRTPTQGGNVFQLPDGAMFVMYCKPFNNVFIIDKDKELRWDAVTERWSDRLKQWIPEPSYRASIINRNELEELIWNTVGG